MKIASKWILSCTAILAVTGLFARADVKIPDECKVGGFNIGCQAYSFNHYTAFEAIEKTASTGSKVIEFYPGQNFSTNEPTVKIDEKMDEAHIAALKEKLAKHGVTAVAYVVCNLGTDEAANRKVFEWAKKMGLLSLTSEPSLAAMDNIEKLVKEFDIMLGIHNHPKQANNPNYKHWDPQFILSLVKDRDARLGSCADIGHFVRSGVKPVDALRILKGRITSSHMKDLHEFSANGHDVPFGTGVSDITAVLDELHAQGFTGGISIEYEYNWTTSVPEIAQCIGFVRGYGKSKGW